MCIRDSAKILELIPFINKALNSKDTSSLKILEKHAVSLTKSAPDNPKSHALLGDVFAAQNNDYDAFISYEKAIKAGTCPKSVWSLSLIHISLTWAYFNVFFITLSAPRPSGCGAVI